MSNRSDLFTGMAVLLVVWSLLGACATVPSISAGPPAAPPVTDEPLGVIEDTRVVFYKSELSVVNDTGVLFNLVATNGGVGIRFYKDFGFGNEKDTNPWHMGWIEGRPGYQGLAILRDWLFTAALWDADGRLTVGLLDPHPPANPPAGARFHVRGTVDEVQALVQSPTGQEADIFQVASSQRAEGAEASPTTHFAVSGAGNAVIGSPGAPKALILYDTADGTPYALTIRNGQLVLTPLDH